jgi:hypothetical protein
MLAFSSPTFLSHHKSDSASFVRFVPVSSLFLSFLLSPETFTSNNTNRAVAFSPYDKPLLRRRLPLITQTDSQKKNRQSAMSKYDSSRTIFHKLYSVAVLSVKSRGRREGREGKGKKGRKEGKIMPFPSSFCNILRRC